MTKTRTSRERQIRKAGGLVAVGAGIAVAFSLPALLAWGFLHPPRRLHGKTPRTGLGIPFERVRLRARDGVGLSAWYVPAPEAGSPKGVVILCHGYHGNRARMLPHLEFLHRAGYAVLMFDWRAHGWSGGKMVTFGSTEPDDLMAALDWVQARPEIAHLPLALFGESMGASVSLLVAAVETERVKAVVADSPYARFDRAVEGRMKLAFGNTAATLVIPGARRVGEALLKVRCEEIAPADAMQYIFPRPVLLIHGQKDRLIALENSRIIAAASPGNLTLWEVPEAAHVQSVHVNGEEYARRVTDFLARAFSEDHPAASR
jgi:alpha-beta hydrolase superfamily lysophospholipase